MVWIGDVQVGLRARLNAIAAILRGKDPAAVYAETSQLAGFLQTPTSPAPDAKPLVENEQISAIVGRCVNVISQDAAQVPLKLFDVSDPKKPVEDTDHPAIRLWRHINPVESPQVYKEQLFADLICEGNHFAWMDVVDGKPTAMIRLPPEQVHVVPHPRRIIAGYSWVPPGGDKQDFDASVVMHVRTRNPNPIYRGLGLLQRLRDQIRFDYQMRSFKESQIANGIPTTMIFQIKRGFNDDADWDRFREETWNRAKGIKNAGKPVFVRADDVTVTPINRPTEDEVAFIASLKWTRNEFAMVFGVPPSRLSDYSESFRANASEQARTYWQDTIMSWHRLLLDYLNSSFIPKWFPEEVRSDGSARIAFAYDYSQVQALALSQRDMATVQEILIRNALRTPNQGAVAMGDSAHDDPAADKLYMNGRPLGEEPELEEIPDNGTRPGEERPQGENEDEEGDTGGGEDRGAAGLIGAGVVKPRPVLRAVPGDPVDEKKEAERLRRELDPIIREMVRRAGEQEIEDSGLLGSFDMKDPRVLEMVRTQSILVSEAVVETTATEVRKALAYSIEQGYDPDQMIKAIRTVYRSARADWRLDRVAGTESHQAAEGGGFQAMRQNGVHRKTWVRDNTGSPRGTPGLEKNPRSDHFHMDGMTVEIDEPFVDPISGARLMYPGDVAGATGAFDVVNCRCVKIADFSDLDERGILRGAAAGRSEILLRKASQRSKFERALKTTLRRFLKAMEERTIAALNNGVSRSVPVPSAGHSAVRGAR